MAKNVATTIFVNGIHSLNKGRKEAQFFDDSKLTFFASCMTRL